MDKKYFKIVPANSADAAQLYAILTGKTFYPEASSVPPLPAAFAAGFDYRQFFILIGFNREGEAIVYTRSEYTVGQFNTNVIPAADWTSRYYMSIAPTVIALPTMNELDASGHSLSIKPMSFLSWDYKNFTNNK